MKRAKRLLAVWLAVALTMCGCCAEGADDAAEMAAYEQDDTVLDPTEEVVFQDSAAGEYLSGALAAVNEMQNILLLGIDARPGERTGRSDTMIILTVDADQNVIRMVSLMRDLYVEIPGRKNNRLNAAYVFGGAELLMQTIEQNFGIHVDHYVAVNFSMLANLIDQLGGLELNVESDYYKDRINAVIKCDNRVLGIDVNDGLLTSAGLQTLTGKQAQAYARYRYGTSDGDFGRTQRQRDVILKILEKLRGLTLVQLFFQVAHLRLALRTCAETVTLILTFLHHILYVVSLGYLPAYLFQYLASPLAFCHSYLLFVLVVSLFKRKVMGRE